MCDVWRASWAYISCPASSALPLGLRTLGSVWLSYSLLQVTATTTITTTDTGLHSSMVMSFEGGTARTPCLPTLSTYHLRYIAFPGQTMRQAVGASPSDSQARHWHPVVDILSSQNKTPNSREEVRRRQNNGQTADTQSYSSGTAGQPTLICCLSCSWQMNDKIQTNSHDRV